MNLLIVIPELTSIADCYGLFKHLIEAKPDLACTLLVNRTASAEEAEYIHEKLNALTERFLNQVPSYLGNLPEDEIVKESVSSQKLIAHLSDGSAMTQSLTGIAQTLLQKVSPPTEGSPMAGPKSINVNPAAADIRE
jgi:MinD-like ATPase involved in chromosome partitioning or flagellar assembly